MAKFIEVTMCINETITFNVTSLMADVAKERPTTDHYSLPWGRPGIVFNEFLKKTFSNPLSHSWNSPQHLTQCRVAELRTMYK